MTDQTTQIDEGSSPFTSAAAPGAMPRRDVMIIAVLLVSTFVVILNETIMSIALPVLAEDLRVDYSQGQWLTSGFLLTMAVVIPVTGFLIRRIRTRVLFMLAMTLFSAGTLLAALAPSFEVLLAARVVQASGTAIMMPLLMTTVMKLVPGERRGAVMGNIGTVIAVAPAIGPTISGFVLHSLGWRALYWLVLPIALAALAFGIRSMIDAGEPERVHDLDRIASQMPGYEVAVAGELITLSRVPIIDHRAIDPPELDEPDDTDFPEFWRYKALRTDLRVGDTVLSVYNVHIPTPIWVGGPSPFESLFWDVIHTAYVERGPHLRALARDVAANDNPVLVAGDMNTTSAMGDTRGFPAGLRDAAYANPALTLGSWPATGALPALWRLDWALVSPDVSVHRYEFLDPHGLSDHRVQFLTVTP